MKAKIITYKTEKMTNSQRSILSKRIFGYKDRTKNSTYIYKRIGILSQFEHIIITKKTFVIKESDAKVVIENIEKLGAKMKIWDISISKKELSKTYG